MYPHDRYMTFIEPQNYFAVFRDSAPPYSVRGVPLTPLTLKV